MSEQNIIIEEERLRQFIDSYQKLTILTGAGVSAASGIPTYRDDDGNWLASDPITHQDFLSKEVKRKRYWMRSLVGWPFMRDALPNIVHDALTNLEKKKKVSLLITQNVDQLHQRAGSRSVLDLHGRIDHVICMKCKFLFRRQEIQDWLHLKNPLISHGQIETRPDGDASLETNFDSATFKIPSCTKCGGILKPDVVFFGGTIPRDRYRYGREAILESDALLVIGSSLHVYSGYSFCRFANDNQKPIMIVNSGPTRADHMAELRCQVDCQKLLASYTLS